MFSNTKITTFFISVLIVLFMVAAWFAYRNLAVEHIQPLNAFPNNTPFIVEIPEPQSALTKLSTENDFWKDLLLNAKVQEIDKLTKAAFLKSEQDEKLNAFFHQPFYLTLLPAKKDKTAFLVLTKSNGITLDYLNSKLFSQLEGDEFIPARNKNAFDKLKINHTVYNLAHSHGLLFLCDDSLMLQKVINQIQEPKTHQNSADFNQLLKTQGKRADAYLYLLYQNLDTLLQAELKSPTAEKLSGFANYSVLDIRFKKDEILLNGYTSAYDSLNHYLANFQNQEGKKSQLAVSLPYTTRSFISINLSDYRSFIENANQPKQLKQDRAKLDKLIHGNSLEITETWWAGEMALVVDEKQREFAVFTANSGREAFRLLADIAHQSQPGIITVDYQDLKIKEINSPYFLSSQFGSLFSGFKEVYFCVIDEAVIFSKSISDLKHYIDAIVLGNNLSKNGSYIEFSDNLSDDAIIRVYSKSPTVSHPLFKRFLNEGNSLFTKYKSAIQKLQGIGFQISNKNDLFYTGLFLTHGENTTTHSGTWQVTLEAPIAAGPFVVKNHASEGNNILVQDEFNTLYYLNNKGDIVWSQPLKERIKSQVFEVDYYKNGKWQYLFNSLNYIYLIDINGNNVGNYPIQLNAEASNGLVVLDYENNKNYRIILAGKNGELYNYELKGRLLKDWKAENTRKEIGKPLSFLITNNKEYLVFEANNGNIIMTDRRGKIRMEIRTSFVNALGSDVYVNHTNRNKGVLLTTDSEGNLTYIPETGAVNKTSFGKMSENHFFLYEDFNGNNEKDFIYLDANKLRVFDKFKNSLLSYDFKNPISLKPQVFKVNNKLIIGVVDQTEKQLYLLDKNGLIQDEKRYGNTAFIVDKLSKNAAPSLLIGLDNSIYNYPLD